MEKRIFIQNEKELEGLAKETKTRLKPGTMDLIIDTTKDNTQITLGKDKLYFPARDKSGNQRIVTEIKNVLNQSKILPDQIDFIRVNPGPGPFTTVRVGVSVANALSRAWNKPIKYLSGEETNLAIPSYNQTANTTKKSS